MFFVDGIHYVLQMQLSIVYGNIQEINVLNRLVLVKWCNVCADRWLKMPPQYYLY